MKNFAPWMALAIHYYIIWNQVDFNQLEEKYPADAVFGMHPFMVTDKAVEGLGTI